MTDKDFILKIKFTRQGPIKGSSSTSSGKGSTGSNSDKGVLCHSFEYAAGAPYDASTGLPSGKRTHHPVVIHREVDAASPLFLQALATKETFTEAVLEFAGQPDSGAGGSKAGRTIELRNGAISNIRQSKSKNGNRSEAITFVYQTILVNGLESKGNPHLG